MRHRVALILALGSLLGFVSAGASAQPTATSSGALSEKRAHALKIAREIIVAARYCTLATRDGQGWPQARILDPLAPTDAFHIYFATNPKSRKVAEIARDSRVTLLYFDPARLGYVTVFGRASVVSGPEKTAHRKPEWDTFFPADKAETFTLYKVVPTRLEVSSSKDGLTGDPITWRPDIVELR